MANIICERMDEADRRKLIETLISEVHLYPKATWVKGKNPVKEIKYAFPVSDERYAADQREGALHL